MAEDMKTLTVEQIEERLDSFDADTRRGALRELARRLDSGELHAPITKQVVNLHYHTFYSYNAYGWSPSRIAWEARKFGLSIAGIVDFDVLDGMDEFLDAGETIGLRATAAVETRVFIPEYADKVINSPNEPGIAYFMAAGCARQPEAGSTSAETLAATRDMARRRNLQVMTRVNEYLGRVRIDYDKHVLPLTPSGNATERHMLAAYDARAREILGDSAELAEFWAEALGIGKDDAATLLSNTPALHEKMRSKLMKFGGVGYVPPTRETFPDMSRVIDMAQGMDALPMMTWLDGTNAGESDMPALLGLLVKQGVVALNVVPDRNWNIDDPDERAIRVENLGKVIAAADELDLPLCIGTELNKLGLPFVDDFAAPEMRPHIVDFVDGAYTIWGHTFLARKADIGYTSRWADAHFDGDRKRKNAFYKGIGRIALPADKAKITAEMTPEQVARETGRV